VGRVQNDLSSRLATAFGRYAAAKERAERYRASVLPNAQKAYRLAQEAFKGGQFEYLRVLQAQRAAAEANLEYVRVQSEAWQAAGEIAGLLLQDCWPAPAATRPRPIRAAEPTAIRLRPAARPANGPRLAAPAATTRRRRFPLSALMETGRPPARRTAAPGGDTRSDSYTGTGVITLSGAPDANGAVSTGGGTITESGGDSANSSYDSHYTLDANGNWDAVQGGGSGGDGLGRDIRGYGLVPVASLPLGLLQQGVHVAPELAPGVLLVRRQLGKRVDAAHAGQVGVHLPVIERPGRRGSALWVGVVHLFGPQRQIGPQPVQRLLAPAAALLGVGLRSVLALTAAGQRGGAGGVIADAG